MAKSSAKSSGRMSPPKASFSAAKPRHGSRKQRLALFLPLRRWFRHGGVPVNLNAKRLCGASRRALAPPSSSNPRLRRTLGVEVGGEESPGRGDSSQPRAPQEAPGQINPPKAGLMTSTHLKHRSHRRGVLWSRELLLGKCSARSSGQNEPAKGELQCDKTTEE